MSSESSVTLADLMAQRQGTLQAVELAQRLERLQQNPDFKAVVLKHWMVDECSRYAQVSEDPALTPEQRADSARMAAAAGHFKRWMAVTAMIAGNAKSSLDELDAAIADMRAADAEE